MFFCLFYMNSFQYSISFIDILRSDIGLHFYWAKRLLKASPENSLLKFAEYTKPPPLDEGILETKEEEFMLLLDKISDISKASEKLFYWSENLIWQLRWKSSSHNDSLVIHTYPRRIYNKVNVMISTKLRFSSTIDTKIGFYIISKFSKYEY